MIQNCRECRFELSTAGEIAQEICVGCAQRLYSARSSLSYTIGELTEKLTRAEEQIKFFERQNERRSQMILAEALGKKAAKMGAQISENPFPESDEHKMWEHGFLTETLESDIGKREAHMRWVLFSILHVKELSDGYGQSEISAKLKTLLDKMGPEYPGFEQA